MPASVTAVVSLLALVLAVVALTLATIANRRWARQPRRLPVTRPATDSAGSPGVGPVDDPAGSTERRDPHAGLLAALADRLEQLDGQVTGLGAQLDRLGTELAEREPAVDPTALRHVALVRYDAFADVGGRLSYSVALLDDTRSGLVLTTLSGKSDVRTYVRAISGGSAEGTLTAEEQQAIDAAVGRQQ